ncbi:GntR family transcriptional regulator [Mycobacterium sp. NPDC003449]
MSEEPAPPPSGGRRMEHAITAIRAAIDAGRMTPGVLYSAYQISETLGISRTPVRDALLRLEEIGLIGFENRQGFRVLVPSPREIAEIFAVRIDLECPSARRAARLADDELDRALRTARDQMADAARRSDEHAFSRHDVELHDALLAVSGNARARQIVKGLRETTRLLGASTAADGTRTLADIAAEHDPIIAAVAQRAPRAAESAMRTHIANTGRLLLTKACDGDRTAARRLWKSVAGRS